MSTPERTVSVVIPNWNGKSFLVPCLNSLWSQETDGCKLDVIVVDNGSTDGSVETVAEFFPETRLIKNATNLGFTKAVNLGLEAARGQWILLLNNDTVMSPHSLRALFAYLQTGDAKLGGVQPLLLSADDPARIDSCGIGLEAHLRSSDLLHGQSRALAPDRPQEIFGTCAACALFKREVFTKCGGFDPDFFSEWDDVDLCLRAHWHGYHFALVPEALVYHHRSLTQSRLPAERADRHRRNQVLTMMKALPPGLRWQTIGYRMLRDAGLLIHYAKQRELGGVFRVWRDCWALRSTMKERRTRLLVKAILSPRDMTSQLRRFMREPT